ncbi:LysE family translocator [Kutzneria sp. CA-103260]|uniref:LysE family translocator n=1 Tax=Kutzneria sp. CA-103260 TaxID=2802641 RepID=UPI001BA5B3AA|nr:LysE family translocator [Kutzneria sp. CA-103260]QUQ70158.1 lysine exporter protein LysE/YggA [Kutzneria sp. CA-103260]
MISLAFVVTCLLMIIAPGPSLAVMLTQSLRSGRAAGLATVAGNTMGLIVWATASAFGLTVLVRTSEIAFVVLKVAGAVYLCWLGVQSLRRSRREPADLVEAAGVRHSPLASLRAGFMTNVTNPKAAVLYLALLPQFLPPDGNPLLDTFVLAAVQMALSASYYTLVVLAIGLARRVLSRPVVRRWLDRVSGLVLVGLGIRMVTLSRAAL